MTLPFAQLSFPEIYERVLVGPLFRPWAGLLLQDVDLAAGDRVLDMACGTGIVARLAKERLGDSAQVVGVDLNPAMLAVARGVAASIDWREGDAGALPLRDNEQFDVILCQQGLQFFPDKAAAAREMRRALAPRGRLALNVWRPDDELPVLRELRRVAEQHLGPVVDARHGFGEVAPLEALLQGAGLGHVRVKTLSRAVRFADGSDFVRLNAMALVSMSAAAKEMDNAQRAEIAAAITSDSVDVVRAHTDETGFTYKISANVATAVG